MASFLGRRLLRPLQHHPAEVPVLRFGSNEMKQPRDKAVSS